MTPRPLTEAGIGKRAARAIERFLALEASGGIMLMVMALAAIACANTGFLGVYEGLLHTDIGVRVADFSFTKDLHWWINDGLMAIFFLLVGMEIKREMKEGHLKSLQQSLLPLVAAAGGMAVPGLIYAYFNAGADSLRGWAIPSATDIAFALGVLALLGSRVPLGLKVFLMAVAVIDDLGAVLIIALFYTAHLSVTALAIAAALLAVLYLLNARGEGRVWLYILLGVLLWSAVLASGVHATIAGVLLGFCIPLKSGDGHAPLHRLQHQLHPWVVYAILPLFAFANAGVDFSPLALSQLGDAVPLGIALGLFVGKQVGIFGASFALIKCGFARLPQHASWAEFYGVSLLCGIGFTMSLFIAGLAFDDPLLTVETRLGVLLGTACSAVVGYAFLRFVLQRQSIARREAIAQDWKLHKHGR
ncbi:MAG: Na+/H+ antiporter NhaA [Rickettsiales bacterium]|nr:Na+/H+ antiporter NhaA [Rickettsiales bacterium]